MKQVKKIVGKVHLWLGLASGLVVLVVAFTGSLMVFRDELELVFYSKQLLVPEVAAQRKSMDELIAIARQAVPGLPVAQARLFQDSRRSVLLMMGKREGGKGQMQVAVDPYTGAVLGKARYNTLFFPVVLQLHRQLLAGPVGKTVTGISCLCFTVLLISGIVLWWPANRQAIRQRFRIKWKASFKRVNWDVHAVFGFYSSLLLLAIALTGLVWSFKWMNNAIYLAADGKLPKPNRVTSKSVGQPAANGLYQQVIDVTNRTYPFRGNLNLIMPAKSDQAISVFKENLDAAVANQSSTIFFDNATGKVLETRPYEKESRGSVIRRMVYPIHTGSLYGWPTKLIALLVSLFAASLPISGTLIWLGRKKKAKKKQPAPPPLAPRPALLVNE